METKILSAYDIEIAGKIIQSGGLVAFPTETVYGLGADVFNEEAAGNIYKAKGRPSDNPLIVHICDKSDIEKIAKDISEYAWKLIDAFMPGPFTIILNKRECIPYVVTGGLDTVAIRFPSNEIASGLIKAAKTPVVAPSANLSGKPSPTEAKHVIDDLSGRVDCIIEGGNCDVGVESTVVDASGDCPVILRPGGITLSDIQKIVPSARVDKGILESVDKPKCPGMKYKHYSPDAQVIVIEGDRVPVRNKITGLLKEQGDKRTGVLVFYEDNTYECDALLYAGGDNREYAKNLFSSLRSFDDLHIDIVFAEFKDDDGYGLAVKNRLYKAAAHNVIKV